MRRMVAAGVFLILLCTAGGIQAEPVVRQIPYARKTGLTVPARYSFEFRLWTSADPADPAGEQVWSERKRIRLRSAKLRHSLGSVTPFSNEGTGLPPVDFSRQLWVEVARLSGGAYASLPGARTMLTAGAYALHAETADTLPPGSVTFGMIAGGAVTDTQISGTISEPKIDASIARDGEILPTVLAGDGSGSGVDADLLDGKHLADLDTRYGIDWSNSPATMLTRWVASEVDGTVGVGPYTSITIGQDGLPVISYRDNINGTLKVAKCVNTSCSGVSTITTADPVASRGFYSSITIGLDESPLISHHDDSNGDLKVAKCANAACTGASTIATVDSAGEVGAFSSITVSWQDWLPMISYYDGTNGDLKVAKCQGYSCTGASTITTLDSAGNVGMYTSIVVGADRFPVISYYDSTNGDLKVAKCQNSGCTAAGITTVDSDGDVGKFTSITIGADGLPMISYYDATNGDLKVAKCTDDACTGARINTIASVGDVGQYSSIAAMGGGLPIIAYYDSSNNSLRIAQCRDAACSGASQWSISSTGIGKFASIAAGADGLPIISYWDEANQHLKVMKMVSRPLGRR